MVRTFGKTVAPVMQDWKRVCSCWARMGRSHFGLILPPLSGHTFKEWADKMTLVPFFWQNQSPSWGSSIPFFYQALSNHRDNTDWHLS